MWAVFAFILMAVFTSLSLGENICFSILYGSLMGIGQSAINAANKDKTEN
jgi:hypothetical protein